MSTVAALARFPYQQRTVSIFPTPTKEKEPASANRIRVGLILLDASLKPIYCNSEARTILTYPNTSGAIKMDLSQRIRSIIPTQPGIDDSPTTTHFMSGRRRYLCRTFPLEAQTTGGKPNVAMTIERDGWMLYDLMTRFQLTEREVEAVQHLALGLTSKEIAQRMHISPNTVKAFLRFVMVKMGVTTRSGVIGKLMHGSHFVNSAQVD
jgi:DNA-binding CsgD family transcriptional regulator